MLLVVHFNTLDELKEYRTAIKAMGLNVHECKILAIVESKREKDVLGEISSVVYMSPQEYSFLGTLKNDEANKLLADKFDAVVYFGDVSKRIERSLQKIKPMITIGVNTEKRKKDLELKSESESPEHLLNFVKQTLEKLQ